MKIISEMSNEELIDEFVKSIRDPSPVFYEDAEITAGQRFEYLGEALLSRLDRN